MRFHDRTRFEVHVFATSAPDTAVFLESAMRGVDWREKVKNSVEHFHETYKMDIVETANLIRGLGIHILLDWDGYSNHGVRAMGLFALQSAPVQIGHQEYIGTMGADYIQYLITGWTERAAIDLPCTILPSFLALPYRAVNASLSL